MMIKRALRDVAGHADGTIELFVRPLARTQSVDFQLRTARSF